MKNLFILLIASSLFFSCTEDSMDIEDDIRNELPSTPTEEDEPDVQMYEYTGTGVINNVVVYNERDYVGGEIDTLIIRSNKVKLSDHTHVNHIVIDESVTGTITFYVMYSINLTYKPYDFHYVTMTNQHNPNNQKHRNIMVSSGTGLDIQSLHEDAPKKEVNENWSYKEWTRELSVETWVDIYRGASVGEYYNGYFITKIEKL